MGDTNLTVGVDLGGTKIEVAVIRLGDEPEFVARERIPTRRDDGYEAIVARLAGFVREVGDRHGAAGSGAIGVSMPGSIARSGLVRNSNTTCLNGRPFVTDLEAALGRRVVAANDANCFALAEARFGAGRGFESVLGLILGSGVGGGLVIRGRVWNGAHGIAGEWGHHTLEPRGRDCYCGRRGCVETYLSGPALEASHAARARSMRSLAEIVGSRTSDPHAAATVEELLDAFGRGLGNVVNVIDPDVIVVGGGLSRIGLLYDQGKARVRVNVFHEAWDAPIVPATGGDSAGVIGAALFVASAG